MTTIDIGKTATDTRYALPDESRRTGHDPYDLWAIPLLGAMKVRATQGDRLGYLISGLGAVADMLLPTAMRRLSGIEPRRYTHSEALGVLAGATAYPARDFLDRAERTAIPVNGGIGWGYPFDWYSRNAPGGLYPADSVPFITVSPYVMEALLLIANSAQPCAARARALFDRSWGFLEALRPMTDTPTQLAVSYGPVDEPLRIINSNAYAAYAYALHARHGSPARRGIASDKCRRITHWVVDRQQASGAWWYIGESRYNNFIDCFHSCFTVKSLLKVARLDASLGFANDAAQRGWAFIRDNFPDPRSGLCRRFLAKGTKDPLYRWDIYDQAEYLGLLVDFGLLDEALAHRDRVAARFHDGRDWYCRIDLLGRRWGRNFLRWGIMPFLYQTARLETALHEAIAPPGQPEQPQAPVAVAGAAR